MIFQYGDITFKRLDAPTEMSLEGSMNYQQLERLSGKPVLQKIGVPLRNIAMTIELYYQTVDVATSVSKLWTWMYSGVEAELIDGAGFTYGTFVIDRVRQEQLKLDPNNGAVLSAIMQLSFLESAPYDQKSDEKLKARKAAFATVEAKPIEVKPKTIISTPQAKTTYGINRSVISSKASIDSVKKADQIPDQFDKYMREGVKQINEAQKNIQEARSQVDKVTATVSNIEQLKATMDATITMTTQFATSITGAGPADLPGIISGTGNTLNNQLNSLLSAAAIITAVTSIRK